MKKILIPATIGLILLSGCQKELNSLPNEAPAQVANSSEKLSLPSSIEFQAQDLFPEGLAYDEERRRFYVSSAFSGQIGIVTFDGSYSPFITDEILTGGTTGLAIDRARNRLWVSNTWAGGVGVYDLNSGSQIFYADFSSLASGDVFVNDLTLDPQGNAYVTNSFGPEIFRVDVNGQVSVFLYDPSLALPPGEFGMTGIQYDPRGYLLVGYADQLLKIPVRDPAAFSVVQLDAPVYTDGLLLSKDGKHLAVVNNTGGTEYDSVILFNTNDGWNSASAVSEFSTGAVFPTSLASDGKKLFVLYSHIDQLLSGISQNQFSIREVSLQNLPAF